jgi:hypothetical protein
MVVVRFKLGTIIQIETYLKHILQIITKRKTVRIAVKNYVDACVFQQIPESLNL